MSNEPSKHDVTDEAFNDVLNGLLKAKKIAEQVFGPKFRGRDVYVIYEHLLGAIHCTHEDEEKEPWQT